MKKKIVKRVIALVVVLGLVGFVAYRALQPEPEVVVYHRTTPITRMDLKNTVDVTGNVASEDSVGVYSAVSQEIIEIAVEVGDTVEEGDLLCRMDTASIQADITSAQANMSKTQQQNQLSMQQAADELARAQKEQEEQNSVSITAAEKAVEDAERTLREVQYDIRTAEANLSEARKENKDVDDRDDRPYSNADLNRLRDAVSQAYLRQEAAEANLEDARQKLERAKSDAVIDLKSLEDAVTSVQVTSDQTADYIALNKLRQDLESCTVTAPISGTVTAVYASEGADSKGLMFMIENTDALIVETKIQEFDVNTVKPGMKVQIKSDATGEEIYEGELISVDPASLKDYDGNTITGSTAEYGAQVRVTSKDHGLRIGMNVRLNIITEQRDDKLAVFYDCVTFGPEGEEVVYVARQQEDGSYIAVMVPVETGMETDLYLEITGGDVAEGDLILQDVSAVYDGMPVNLEDLGGGMDMTGDPTLAMAMMGW